MCYDGVPNVVLRTGDNKVYIFKGYSYWQWNYDTGIISTASNIRDDWRHPANAQLHLDVSLDLGFTTFSNRALWSDSTNHTLFAKVRT